MKACYVQRYIKYVKECKQPHYGAVRDWFKLRHLELQDKSELERMCDLNRSRVRELEKRKDEIMNLCLEIESYKQTVNTLEKQIATMYDVYGTFYKEHKQID